MAGIAGVFATDRRSIVEAMLDAMAHRGRVGCRLLELPGATLGGIWPRACGTVVPQAGDAVRDDLGFGRCAEARLADGRPLLWRDAAGVAPLYWGRTTEGVLCFASEVKAMLTLTQDVRELPPGYQHDGQRATPWCRPGGQRSLNESPEVLIRQLQRQLSLSLRRTVELVPATGALLSGGLNSSLIAALARPHVTPFHTFAGGLPGSADLQCAREVAKHIESIHHEVLASAEQILAALPLVIYHLESFDPPMVRSAVINYLAAREASKYVPAVLCGEGGDALFGGHEYLKDIPVHQLPDELMALVGDLHNTVLQRVDRCTAAHGLAAHVVFLTPEVVELALRIPADLKLRDQVGKWILRRAAEGLVPSLVLNRSKAAPWEGVEVGGILSQHAEERITDTEFEHERGTPYGWVLQTKEELLYFRIFREHFGHAADLVWMGRAAGRPAT